MLALYDPETGGYLITEEQRCVARWDRDGREYSEGDICGYPAQRWAGDMLLCMKHYKRLMWWIKDDEDLALERDARRHEQRMRQEKGLAEQSVRLTLERRAALAEAKAADSVVYYLRRVADGMIKIGFSASPRTRLNDHRREQGEIEVLLVLGGDRDEENEAHGKFRRYQIGRTEWFRPVRPLLEWIREAREGHTHPDVQPDDILPMEEIRELVLAAVPLERLCFDEDGRVLWPPDAAVA